MRQERYKFIEGKGKGGKGREDAGKWDATESGRGVWWRREGEEVD